MPSLRERFGFPVTVYGVVGIVVLLVAWFSYRHLDPWPFYAGDPAAFPGDGVLGGWFRYDGGWYRFIVEQGYSYGEVDQQASIAFFPAYPLVMMAVDLVVGNAVLAGIVVTAVCGLSSAILLYRWTRLTFGEDVARLATVLLLVYPYAWYLFGAVYADALFLVAAIGAFLLLEKGHPVLAGLAGVVATAGRPVGIALVVGLVAVTIHKRGGIRSWRSLRPSDGGVLLSLGGLVGWSTYLWVRFGDPLLFSKIQGAAGWDQGSGPHTWFKVTLFERLQHLPFWLRDSFSGSTTHDARPWTESVYSLGTIFQGLLVVGGLVLVPVIWKRLGSGYAIYVGTIVAIALVGTKDFQGTGRYMLAAFPCFAVGAQLLVGHRRRTAVLVACSGALLVVLTSAFSRGYYVA